MVALAAAWAAWRAWPERIQETATDAVLVAEMPVPFAPRADITPLPPAPREDLALVGVMGAGAMKQALFALTAADGAVQRFVLGEGERNDWLHLRAVDLERGTATVVLARPLNRSRTPGVDLLLSLPKQGRRTKARPVAGGSRGAS